MKLSQSTPAQIPIDKPSSKRAEIGIGIVHFGVDGFRRAHQARYVDRLLDDVIGARRTLETLSQKETP
jgi:mannitol 2-dehydrogenase